MRVTSWSILITSIPNFECRRKLEAHLRRLVEAGYELDVTIEDLDTSIGPTSITKTIGFGRSEHRVYRTVLSVEHHEVSPHLLQEFFPDPS